MDNGYHIGVIRFSHFFNNPINFTEVINFDEVINFSDATKSTNLVAS